MGTHPGLGLDLWRLLGAAATIDEAVEGAFPLLAEHLPLDGLLVRRLEIGGPYLETLASSFLERPAFFRQLRTDLGPSALQRLLVACQDRTARTVSHHDADDPLELTVPPGIRAEVMAGPLWEPAGPLGVALFVAAPGVHFGHDQRRVATDALEPLAAALATHNRIHRILTESEAAQADRNTLLTKLGRRQIDDGLVGFDSGLREVMQQVEQVGQSDVPVLIFGETGSGKEVIARAIHNRSRRATGTRPASSAAASG